MANECTGGQENTCFLNVRRLIKKVVEKRKLDSNRVKKEKREYGKFDLILLFELDPRHISTEISILEFL